MSNIRYLYVRNFGKQGRRNATVAYVIDEANGEVRSGATLCSSKDQFNKKLGRTIAVGRLNENPRKDLISDIGSDRYIAIDLYLRKLMFEIVGDNKDNDLAQLEIRNKQRADMRALNA